VANGQASAVSVIDARTHRVVGRVPVGRRPWGVALSADGRWLYTANGLSNDLTVVDTRTLRVTGTIRVGTRPWGIAVAR
jgi:YVTN family beta-propeller protein